jgi:hypothetical protein
MSQTRPSRTEIADLKRLAAGIIRTQGNRFIKELLRANDVRLGTNKDDFERNLSEAIASGALRLADVDAWLQGVEGWGNQHVYLYRLSPSLRKELTEPKIRQRVSDAGLDDVWGASSVMAFPEEPEVTSISFSDSVLRIVWHESSPGWTRVIERDYRVEEGLDTFEFRAWRRIDQRAVTRFEARVDKGLAALFIADPIQGGEHQVALEEAKRVIAQLISLSALERQQVDVSAISRNLDQQSVPSAADAAPKVKTQKSRLASGSAYVEFAANSPDRAYWEEDAIRAVRRSVGPQQLGAFQGTGGTFLFQPGSGSLTRPLRVQLYGGGTNRIRLWAQMTTDEVWMILAELSTY